MLSLRRRQLEPRMEIMPLIDVIFLLLTFFIYAFVLMVRIELVDVPLPAYKSGDAAEPAPAVTLTINLEGHIYVDTDRVELDDLREAVAARQAEKPEARIYLALADGEGTVDRGPMLTQVWDELKDAGVQIHLVGRPKE